MYLGAGCFFIFLTVKARKGIEAFIPLCAATALFKNYDMEQILYLVFKR
jgi:hypothetical protein